MHPVAKTLRAIGDELNTEFVERGELVEALLLALLAGEHALILGAPGIAKTAIIEALVKRLTGATFFATNMSKTKPIQALLGPQDMQALEQSRFVRKGDGYLQSVDLAFIDEIGRMSAVIGDDMLSILNERMYYEVDNGRCGRPVPLHTCFTASNSVLTKESDDAAALDDRLLVRVLVTDAMSASAFMAMLDSHPLPNPTTLPFEELKQAAREVVPAIPLTPDARHGLAELRAKVLNAGFTVSPRRWKWSLKAMQASAFLDGRDELTLADLHALRFTLWKEPEDVQAIQRLCLLVSDERAERLLTISDGIAEIRAGLAARAGKSGADVVAYAQESNKKLRLLLKDLDKFTTEALDQGRSTRLVDEVREQYKSAYVDVYVNGLGMDEATVRAQLEGRRQ